MDETINTQMQCNEILQNIKSCLLKCKNNDNTHSFNNTIFNINIDVLKDCQNINKFKNEISHQTNIEIIFAKPVLCTLQPYTIKYQIEKKTLIVCQL